MNKKILLMFTFLFSFFMFKDNVFAGTVLKETDYTLECLYSDGGLYTNEWSNGRGAYIVNRTSYNLTDASQSDTNKGGDMVFVNTPAIRGRTNQQYTTCALKLYSAVVQGSNDAAMSYFKFNTSFTCNTSDNSCPEFGVEKSGWSKFWGTAGALKEYASAAEAANNSPYNLISERYLFSNNIPEPNKTLYYVLPATQKIGTNMYVKIYIYDNITLLDKDGRITRLDGDTSLFSQTTLPEKIYLNSPEPIPVTGTNSVVSYKYNADQIIYSFTTASDPTHTIGFTNSTDNPPDDSDTSSSLCTEKLKNTSPVLKSIIQFGQILLPALVIILTGLDIGKIVVTGNIEEELPKRKKTIINRAIVLLILLFLPLLVKVMLKIVKDTGSDIANNIEYIDCLFDSSAKAGTAKKGSTTKKSNNSKNENVAVEK